MKTKHVDMITSVILILLMAFFWSESNKVPIPKFTDVGSAFFPRVVFIITAFLSVLLFLTSLFSKSDKKEPKEELKDILLRWGAFATVVAYVILLPILGYVWATLIFMMALMLLLGKRTAKTLPVYAVVTLVTTFGVQYIFGNVMKLFLP